MYAYAPPPPSPMYTQGGQLDLPDLRFTDSSESVLQGKKPPLRLMVRVAAQDRDADGMPTIHPAVSGSFVVRGLHCV